MTWLHVFLLPRICQTPKPRDFRAWEGVWSSEQNCSPAFPFDYVSGAFPSTLTFPSKLRKIDPPWYPVLVEETWVSQLWLSHLLTSPAWIFPFCKMMMLTSAVLVGVVNSRVAVMCVREYVVHCSEGFLCPPLELVVLCTVPQWRPGHPFFFS